MAKLFVKRKDWKWYGQSMYKSEYNFQLITEVGEFLISTIGIADHKGNGEFETIVNPIMDGRRCSDDTPIQEFQVIACSEYNNTSDANEGHVLMCERCASSPSYSSDPLWWKISSNLK